VPSTAWAPVQRKLAGKSFKHSRLSGLPAALVPAALGAVSWEA